MSHGSIIKQRRVVLGLTQQQVADSIGCEDTTIQGWESKDRSPSIAHLVGLADALSCSVDYLLGRVDAPAIVNMAQQELSHLDSDTERFRLARIAYEQDPTAQNKSDLLTIGTCADAREQYVAGAIRRDLYAAMLTAQQRPEDDPDKYMIIQKIGQAIRSLPSPVPMVIDKTTDNIAQVDQIDTEMADINGVTPQ